MSYLREISEYKTMGTCDGIYEGRLLDSAVGAIESVVISNES